MPGCEFSFLLKSVSKPVAESYLKETYQIELLNKGDSPVFLYFDFGNPSSCLSYRDAALAFPANCIIYKSTQRSCFILYADQIDFNRVLTWAKEHSCQKMISELEKKLQPQPPVYFKVRNEQWNGAVPKVMAILNITPDSFYDGGKYYGLKDYGEVAARLIEEGADIIDIGGESSRPGSQSVSQEEEIKRVLPAVKQIRSRFEVPISVDTVKPEVARMVLSNGADMINDISGLSAGSELLGVIRDYDASYCLMHIQGKPERMQQNPVYQDVVAEVYEFFLAKLEILLHSGLAEDKICIDPGIGFGKQFEHNMDLLRFLAAFSGLKQMILLGTSNKSFIGQALNREPEGRLPGTLTTQVMGWLTGAGIFRVHDVKATRDSLQMVRFYADR